MANEFPLLFSPLQIGPVTVPNRIVCCGHSTGFAEDHLPTERHVHYYVERARGGCGLIVGESTYVHRTSQSRDRCVIGNNPAVVPGFRQIATAVHDQGAKIFGQLTHRGREATSFFSRLQSWAPSPIPCPSTRETPHEMSQEEIAEIVDSFGQGAGHYREAGYDGVEIHGAHGFLVEQFMSPWANHREDEYGGSLENRLRFAREVITAARRSVGDDMALGIRLSGDQLTPGGLNLDDMKEICRLLAADGMLDYFSISAGNLDTVVIAGLRRAEDGLYRALKGRVPELHMAGDCVAPRRAGDAIREGHLAGRNV